MVEKEEEEGKKEEVGGDSGLGRRSSRPMKVCGGTWIGLLLEN